MAYKLSWASSIFYLFLLLNLGESAGRSFGFWSDNVAGELSVSYSWPVLTAGVFVLIALVLSLFLTIEHLAFYNQPEEQKFLIGLIMMVPVYAVESFLSLANAEVAFYCQVMRDCYEAFAMYCFERYLIACLGGEENTINLMERQFDITSSTPLLEAAYAGVVKHPFPLNFLIKQWYLGADFYQAVKIGIVQYMILKTICAFLAIILESLGIYGEGLFQWRYGYAYLAVILNFSQTWALYCLIQFYTVTKEKLEPIKPLAKFLTFKSIVFLTWWQGVIFAIFFSLGFFRSYLAQQLKTRIQDYIICIEMGIAAVVHLYVFPAKPYRRGERCVRNVAVMSDYASLGVPPDPDEVSDCERTTRMTLARPDDKETGLKFPRSLRDVVLGSSEIIADDVKFTVSHVVEPMERGFAKVSETFNQISENVKRHEEQRRRSKDDSYVVPLQSWTRDFPENTSNTLEGSISDSGIVVGKKYHSVSRSSSQYSKASNISNR